ncbi:hypothetical protein GJ496_003336 [Pomphorhynchus laevis]|nr:hypothetical protein GJ496_003336 [Pomphorhynchus laevis]
MIILPDKFYGCNHIVVHGLFIYNRFNSNEIVSVNINSAVQITSKDNILKIDRFKARYRLIPEKDVNMSMAHGMFTDSKVGIFDIAEYDGFIWVVYRNVTDGYYYLSQLNKATLYPVRRSVRIKYYSKQILNTFIAHGFMYFIAHIKNNTAQILTAYDIENEKLISKDLPPLRLNGDTSQLTHVSYDLFTEMIYCWSNNYILVFSQEWKSIKARCQP